MLAGVFFALLSASNAHAQRATNFQLEYFEPRPTQKLNFLNIHSADVLGKGSPSLGLIVHYTDASIIQQNLFGVTTAKPVASRVHAEILAAIGLFGWAELGLAVPLVYGQGDDLALLGAPGSEIDGIALADPRILFKTKLWDREGKLGFGLALSQTLYIPVGDADVFASDDGFKFLSEFIVDWRHEAGFGVFTNVGYLMRPKRIAINYVSDDSIRWGIGLQSPTGIGGLEAFASIYGQLQLTDNRNVQNLAQSLDDGRGSPIEFMLGPRWRFAEDWLMTGAVGIGASAGVGAPSYRLVLGIERQLEEFNPFRDSDGDGITDFRDDCPADAEDEDGYQDDDGCPEPDNDGYGIEDIHDKCPFDSEDLDDFADLDGCPDPDNDGDGILDERDRCPLEVEDFDTFADEDGCPDPDNDGDGIQDIADLCPLEPEDYDGDRDHDGCPDVAGAPLAKALKDLQIRHLPFDTGKSLLSLESIAALNDVAEILLNHPEVSLVQIEGYTDSRGGDAFNVELSRERANAVRRALISRGVAPARLKAVGLGKRDPIASNDTDEGQRLNRRVEFRILDVSGSQVTEEPLPAPQQEAPAQEPPPLEDFENVEELNVDEFKEVEP